MKTIEQLMRRRMWANRLSRWVALLFFVLATSFYAIDSDIAKFLLPIRTMALIGLLIAGVLFIIQLIEFRRIRTHPPIVVVTGIILSFILAGYVYVREFASYNEAEFEFSNKGTTFAGTLYLPSEEGIYPAAVISPGSIKASRRLYHVWSDILVRNGIAVLNFDKRGTGDSGGEIEGENFGSVEHLTLLASDLQAAVDALRARPEIDPTAVGVIGMSLGAWYTSIAADSLGDLAYMVMLSGPTVSVGEEDYFNELSEDGQDRSADEVIALVERKEASGFDPRGVLTTLNTPTLWLYGGQDLSIPVPICTSVLDTLVQQSDRPFAYKTYEQANHLLVLPDWPFNFPGELEQDIVGFIHRIVHEGTDGGIR